MREPLTNEEVRLGRRLAAHLDAMPLEDPRVIVRSVVAAAAETRPTPHRRDAVLVLIAAALVIGGIGAIASGAVRLREIPDTVVLPPGPSLPAPPVITPAPTPSGSPEVTSSPAAPVEAVNGDVLIASGGRIFLTDPTGERDPFELPGPDGPDWTPQWSPDGQQILVLNGSVDGEPDLSVWVMRPDGRGAEQLTGTPAVPLRHAQDAAWSPDGTRVAIRGDVDGRVGIHVLDIASRSIVATTTDAGMAIEPAWSPDGTRIAIHVAEGRIGVWTIGNEPPTVVVDGVTVSGPMWRSDDRIVFWEMVQLDANRFYWPLFQVRPDGTGRQQLTDPGNGRMDSQPRVSPDGSTLAFLRIDQFGAESAAPCCGTIIRPFDTGTERLLGDYAEAVWSPDGKWMAVNAIDPPVAPEDPTSMKNEWIVVRVADGEERFLLSRNSVGGRVTGKELSWGSRPPD